MILKINTHVTYDVIIERGALNHLIDYMPLYANRQILIITDSMVPTEYLKTVVKQFKNAYSLTIEAGEESKNMDNYLLIQKTLLSLHFKRKDVVIALGGGVVGDLAGFVASTYMRGIKFVNIPTTTLSQIDSSVGGKTAINFEGVKNIIGSFYQPNKVIIDFDVLKTLPRRHYINGLVEALKIGIAYDPKIVKMFESGYNENLDQIIIEALEVKKFFVEKDEYENGIRKILNFGHTIGHALESYFDFDQLYHGEAVAIGMLYMINDSALKNRISKIYDKMGLKKNIEFDPDEVYRYIVDDKKGDAEDITIINVRIIGQAEMSAIKCYEVRKILEGAK